MIDIIKYKKQITQIYIHYHVYFIYLLSYFFIYVQEDICNKTVHFCSNFFVLGHIVTDFLTPFIIKGAYSEKKVPFIHLLTAGDYCTQKYEK